MSAREPFGRIDVWWFRRLREARATPMARDLLGRSGKSRKEDTGKCWPSVALIATTLGVSKKGEGCDCRAPHPRTYPEGFRIAPSVAARMLQWNVAALAENPSPKPAELQETRQ